MDPTQTEAVYELVVRGFADLGAPDPRCVSRSLLLHGMHYAGQEFRCDGWRAVWLVGGETIEFYDAAGNLAKSVSLVTEAARNAA